MRSGRGLLLMAGVALALLVGGLVLSRNLDPAVRVGGSNSASEAVRTTAGVEPITDARAAADRVLAALQARDGAALAALVHPAGVRVSPSAYVDVAADQVLSAAEAAKLWTDARVRTWGSADGSDQFIKLTPADYAARYILERDYSAATVSINGALDRGTTVDNSAAVYPGATRVEYFVQGNDATDWSALRLILIPVGREWKLAGIIHDAWSP